MYTVHRLDCKQNIIRAVVTSCVVFRLLFQQHMSSAHNPLRMAVIYKLRNIKHALCLQLA